MSESPCREIPVVFDCQGQDLVGIAHVPPTPGDTGIVCVIAGGPQYRAGVGRNMVLMARNLAATGVAVFRFDHRGLGDSGGEFGGFEHTHDDIQAAVDCFRRTVPEVRRIVLWGGCDAASGCMIHGCDIEGVASMVLGNPWITTTQIQAAVQQQHYLTRLRQWSFWRKLLRFEYDLMSYARAAMQRLSSRLRSAAPEGGDAPAPSGADVWINRMLDGLQRFDGPVLFLMSGQSLVSKEFDELLGSNRDWAEVCQRPNCQRLDLPHADQTFSTADSRRRVNEALRNWVRQLSAGA